MSTRDALDGSVPGPLIGLEPRDQSTGDRVVSSGFEELYIIIVISFVGHFVFRFYTTTEFDLSY